MKENLFFRATRSDIKKGESNSIFFLLMMLVLLMIPAIFYASALENDTPPQNQQGVIYVGQGALGYGLSDISIAVVVNVPTPTNIKEVTQPKKKSASISEQVVTRKISVRHRARKIQEEVTARTSFYYFSEGNLDSIAGSSPNAHSGELATVVTSFEMAGKSPFSPYVLHFFAFRSEKQKFYTSLSFIQFRNFRSSSLRAPPFFTI